LDLAWPGGAGPIGGPARNVSGATMADKKPKPRAKRKKRRRAPQDEYVRGMVAIEERDWDRDWRDAFGLDGRRDSLDPYGASPSRSRARCCIHQILRSRPSSSGGCRSGTSTRTSGRNHEPSGWRLPFKTTNTTFRALLRIASSVLTSGFSRTAASRQQATSTLRLK
jgi:hypothetical protein